MPLAPTPQSSTLVLGNRRGFFVRGDQCAAAIYMRDFTRTCRGVFILIPAVFHMSSRRCVEEFASQGTYLLQHPRFAIYGKQQVERQPFESLDTPSSLPCHSIPLPFLSFRDCSVNLYNPSEPSFCRPFSTALTRLAFLSFSSLQV